MFRLRKKANLVDELGPGYENVYGQVTPFHILFKDHGNKIAELPKDQAVEYCINQIRDLNDKHGDDPGYANISDAELKDIREDLLANNDNGMDILFSIKDMLLATEGVGEEPEEGAPPQMEEQQEDQTQEQETQEQEIQEPVQEEVQPEVAPEPVVEEQPVQAAIFRRLMKKRG